MKKNNFILVFSSVILTLVILLIPNNEVKAFTLNDGTEVPELPRQDLKYYSIFETASGKTALVYYQERYITTIDGHENSYIQDLTRNNSSTYASVFYNSVGGFCIGSEPKISLYILSGDTWSYSGYDCYGVTLPTLGDFDISFENITIDGAYMRSHINDELVQSYYKKYVKYSNVYLYKGFVINGTIDEYPPILYYSPESNIQKENLDLKKEFTHKYNNNTLKYIDLYFDNNDYGKTINFKLDIIDNSDYSLCDGSSDFVNGNSCVKPELIRTQMAFLEDYGNGLYKWTGGITLGDTIDYTITSNENGFTITGKINLDHDLNLFNYKKIRVSFNLGSAYNVTYSYSDNSTITSNNIDEYYSWMMLLEEQRLNRIDYNYTKYTILTTDYETFSSDILVEYVNTSKYLFVEYFDTELSTYLQNGNIHSTPNYINNRDIEKFTINIGTSNNRGVYLLNHLKNEELATSKYYFYIPEDLYFSQTESLGNSIYIDNTGANNTNGVIAKPDDNYEDSSFANDFFNTFQNNDFGLSAVISSPLRFIQDLNSNTCSTIDLTLPYVNKSLQLPCMTEIYEKNFGEIFYLYQIITTGFVAYWVSVRVYALVKNFKNPEDDKIEVMDL